MTKSPGREFATMRFQQIMGEGFGLKCWQASGLMRVIGPHNVYAVTRWVVEASHQKFEGNNNALSVFVKGLLTNKGSRLTTRLLRDAGFPPIPPAFYHKGRCHIFPFLERAQKALEIMLADSHRALRQRATRH